MGKLPKSYTREQLAQFKSVIENPVHLFIFEILFGSGARIAEIIGETRKRCITCRHLVQKGKAYCDLTMQTLPKSARKYVCEKHEQKHPGLNVEDVDLEAASLRLVGKGDVERMIALSPKAQNALRQIIGAQKTGKINFGIGIRRVEQLATFYAKKAGLPDCDKYGRWSPHKMRHTHLTLLVDAARELGENEAALLAKEQAGHKRIETTQIYLHTGISARHKVLGKQTDL